MLKLGLQLNRLHSPLRQSIRFQVSRAAKKIADNKQPVPPPVVRPADAQVKPLQETVSVNKRKERAIRILPRFMKNYASRIAKAPLSHVTSFLIVHELSAIVPLFAVWGAFYYFDYVPLGIPDYVVQKGAHFIQALAERQGWTLIAHAEAGSRLVLQGAAAWAIVKAILPLRIAFSLWAMPAFARWVVVPVTSRVSALFRKLFVK